MKKLLALFLALTMVLGLAACSGSDTPAGTTAPAASSTGKDTPPADPTTSGEVSHIKLELITLMTVPSAEATKNVENDINKYLKETLGISNYVLDLTIISVADFATTIPMELAGGSARVIDVALKYGYDTPESFSRAFTRFHGIAPSEAKHSGQEIGRAHV